MFFDPDNIIDSHNEWLRHDIDMQHMKDMNADMIDAMNNNARIMEDQLRNQVMDRMYMEDHKMHELRRMQKTHISTGGGRQPAAGDEIYPVLALLFVSIFVGIGIGISILQSIF